MKLWLFHFGEKVLKFLFFEYFISVGLFLFWLIMCAYRNLRMSRGRVAMMDLKRGYDVEGVNSSLPTIEDDEEGHELWPLGEIDTKKSKFPCCLVWTPLPVVSWLAPFMGHVGVCREDGVILDFAGSNFVNVDAYEFGPPAMYLQLDRTKVMDGSV